MMELLPSGKTLVNLSLNFVHFMRHLYTYIYICIEVVERYTHTRSFSSGGNQWEHIFLYPMDRVLKEEDLARVPFLDDDPPGALLQIGRRYLGKIYRGHPLPRRPRTLERFLPFHASPIEIEGSI